MTDVTMRLERLSVWPQFLGREWQLPEYDILGGRFLIRWVTAPESVEGGAPDLVAALLTSVLFRHAALTFPSAIRPPVAGGLLSRKWRLGHHFQWLTAHSVEDARHGIFDAEYFSWNQQGQVVVLSEPTAIPRLDERHLDLAANTNLFDELVRAGARGVLLPGVDGDVAGLYMHSPDLARTMIEDLARQTIELGGQFVTATTETSPSI